MPLSIAIGMDPDLVRIGGFLLTWHGFFTFVGVALVVWLAARQGERAGVHPDVAYSVAIWAIVGGVVGARLVHVIDRWDYYQHNLLQIFFFWEPGIAIWGALLGAFAAVGLYCYLKRYPLGLFGDIAAPWAILGMGVGRFGDIINGEHIGTPTSVPWAFVYTNPKSPTNQFLGLTPTHPAVVYEMVYDFAVAFALVKLQQRLRPHGMVFTALLALYALGRFIISFYRLRGGEGGERVWLLGLSEAQVISLIVLAIAVPLLAWKAQWLRQPTPLKAEPPVRPSGKEREPVRRRS